MKNTMNRILTIVCAAALLLSLMLPASAADGLTFTAANATEAAGEVDKPITVKINVSGNTGLAGVRISVAHDASLKLTEVKKGSALTKLDFTPGGNKDEIPFTLLWDGMDADTSNGTIAELTFVPKAAGHFDVTLSSNKGDIYDNDLNDVNPTFEKLTISIAGEDGSVSAQTNTDTKPVTVDPAETTTDQTVNVETTPAETTPEAPATGFADVGTNDWFKDSVAYVVEKGLMNGTGAATFSPSGTMTRAMLMTVLARYAGVDTTGGATWFEKGMNWAKENDISDGTNPEGNVTREQLATMLYRYLQSKGGGFTGTWSQKLDFTDAGEVHDWALEAITWMTMNGIITGMGDGKLAPTATATRAQVATMLMRYVELIAKAAIVTEAAIAAQTEDAMPPAEENPVDDVADDVADDVVDDVVDDAGDDDGGAED